MGQVAPWLIETVAAWGMDSAPHLGQLTAGGGLSAAYVARIESRSDGDVTDGCSFRGAVGGAGWARQWGVIGGWGVTGPCDRP